MVLKEAKVISPEQKQKKKELRQEWLWRLIGVALTVGGIALAWHSIHQYHSSGFGPTNGVVFKVFAFTIIGIVLFVIGGIIATECIILPVLLLISCVIFGAVSTYHEDDMQKESFENSIVKEYKQKHHLDKVQLKFENSKFDYSKNAYVRVYRFTDADDQTNLIAYYGHTGSNDIIAQKTLNQVQFDKLIEGSPYLGEWK